MSSAAQLTYDTDLPATFRCKDILAFHGRDGQGIAEHVSDTSLEKGIVWEGRPALLSIRFESSGAMATLHLEDPLQANSQQTFERMVQRMLGLNQPIEAFENLYRDHPQLGALIALHPGLRVPVCPTPFEALAWAITGQQISVQAAISLRRKLIVMADLRHAGGLYCFPTAEQMLGFSEGDLREVGFSSGKANTMLAMSAAVAAGQLPLDDWTATMPVDEMRQQLAAMRGIGPWTIHYTLLRGYGWMDGSLHGDVAVQRALGKLLCASEKLSARETENWLASFTPWRALVGAHLWATLSLNA